jgi:hypothetical protein
MDVPISSSVIIQERFAVVLIILGIISSIESIQHKFTVLCNSLRNDKLGRSVFVSGNNLGPATDIFFF